MLEPAVRWAAGDCGGPGVGLILSSCDRVVACVDDVRAAEPTPDRAGYPQLPHPPFRFDPTPWRRSWRDLRLEGFLGDALVADGADPTRLLVRVTDEHGNGRPYTTGAVQIDVDGPLTLIGDAPAALVGGVAGAWLRAQHDPRTATVRVRHATLGSRTVQLRLTATEAEPW